MRSKSKLRSALLVITGLILVAGGVAWHQRDRLWMWHHLAGLESASEANREEWAAATATHGMAAVPTLVSWLKRDDAQTCQNAAAVFEIWLNDWASHDGRRAELSLNLVNAFDEMSHPGKEATLEWHLAATTDASSDVRGHAMELVRKSTQGTATGVRIRALMLGGLALDWKSSEAVVECCRKMAITSMDSPSPKERLHAVRLVLHEKCQVDEELLSGASSLLHDKDKHVRRAALLAVGTARNVVSEDKLLSLLHDEDEDIQRLCEMALRQRGFLDEEILLGRIVSHREPAERIRLVEYLPRITKVKPGVWLDRLSRDRSPAVRAAAIRSAAANVNVDFRARLQQMAASDPSETVRQLAQFYSTPNRN